jgi:flagellar protein FliS
MSTASLRARYLGDTVTTASPQRLLVMLYDRLALDLERGHAALAAGDRNAATEQLQHAQDVVFGLLESLQIDAWEGAPRLAALYNWLIAELGHAVVKGDVRRVADCRKIVEPLRDAWREAAASLASAPA